MSRRVRLGRLAELEVQEAIEFYEDRQEGLGLRFWTAVDEAVEHLAEDPIAISTPVPDTPEELDIRRAFVRSFPYQIVFIEWLGEIRILAVAHFSRKPKYWIDRVPGG